MKSISVLVADNNPLLLKELSQEIERDEQLNLIGTTDNGKNAYDLIQSYQPDVVLFDLLLPIYDGFSLVEKLKYSDVNMEGTKLILTSPMTNPSLVSEMFRRGIDYVLAKPYDVNELTEKIKRFYSIMNSSQYKSCGATNKKAKISNILKSLGIPVKLSGYRYISTAIEMVIQDETFLDSVTKLLYPEVAKQHHSTPQRVEKAIRHAIEVAWTTNKDNLSLPDFKQCVCVGKKRPTNSEFIAVISKQLNLSA